jgi:hypothetical protein
MFVANRNASRSSSRGLQNAAVDDDLSTGVLAGRGEARSTTPV